MQTFLNEKESENKLLLDSSEEEDSFEKEMNEYMQVQAEQNNEGLDAFERKAHAKVRPDQQKQNQEKVHAKKSGQLCKLEFTLPCFLGSSFRTWKHYGYLSTGKLN